MQYKMVVLDLDGTSITSDYRVTDTLINYISKLQKLCHVYIATGRSVSDAIAYYNTLKMDNELIVNNGSFVYNPNSKLVKTNLTMKKGGEILKYLLSEKLQFSIDNIVVTSGDKTYLLSHENEYLQGIIVNRLLPFEYINEFQIIKVKDIHRIIVSVNPRHLEELTNVLKSLYPEMIVCHWNKRKDIVDISLGNVDKWNAIRNIVDSMNISKEEVVAIGDSDNDIAMLSEAGLGICMLNGTEKAKKVSNLITEYDNDNDGVYKVLSKLFPNIE